jgi:hypothetical protein
VKNNWEGQAEDEKFWEQQKINEVGNDKEIMRSS